MRDKLIRSQWQIHSQNSTRSFTELFRINVCTFFCEPLQSATINRFTIYRCVSFLEIGFRHQRRLLLPNRFRSPTIYSSLKPVSHTDSFRALQSAYDRLHGWVLESKRAIRHLPQLSLPAATVSLPPPIIRQH